MIYWLFLDAFSHLYKRVCLSIRPSVRPLVRHTQVEFPRNGRNLNTKLRHFKDNLETCTSVRLVYLLSKTWRRKKKKKMRTTTAITKTTIICRNKNCKPAPLTISACFFPCPVCGSSWPRSYRCLGGRIVGIYEMRTVQSLCFFLLRLTQFWNIFEYQPPECVYLLICHWSTKRQYNVNSRITFL